MTGPIAGQRRDWYLQRLLNRLLDDPDPAARLALHTRELSDPTVALLDAWASLADVLSFYRDRIAAEGYLDSAVEASSVLAIANLLGTRPRPPMAASAHLAYTLHDEPDDAAVILSAGLLVQSVPGPGEQPQTFETAADLVARPSWNLLAPLAARPLPALSTAPSTAMLAIGGTTSRLTANSVLVLRSGTELIQALRVRTVRAEPAGDRTELVTEPISLAGARQTGGNPNQTAATGNSLPGTIGGLLGALSRQPGRASPLRRGPGQVFGAGSDTTPRLVAALHPELADTLYSALASSEALPDQVPTLFAMRVVAAPYGAQVPPQPVLDERGQQVASIEWGIGGNSRIAVTLTGATIVAVLRESGAALAESLQATLRGRQDRAVVAVSASAPGHPDQFRAVPLEAAPGVDLGELGRLSASGTGDALTVSYRDGASGVADFELTVTAASGSITFGLADGTSCDWLPLPGRAFHAALGLRQLDLRWNLDSTELTVSLSTPLPAADASVLHLDARYDQILPGTPIVITQAGQPSDEYPLVATVTAIDAVSITRYGTTARVSRLQLDRAWIGDQRTTADLRELAVYAHCDPLALLPVPITDDLSGQQLELDGLHSGLQAGRELIITGRRVDLATVDGTASAASGTGTGGATMASVEAGEVVTVAAIDISTDSDLPGATPHTTLSLLDPLTYTYRRDSVRIYANVVRAHLGATRVEVLGSGNPALASQAFVLSTGPTLDDPTPTGAASSLRIRVDGQYYDEVSRIDASTAPASYRTGLDPLGRSTISFAGPLPAGTDNVVAEYRVGAGGQANVSAHQLSQLLSRPLAVTAVDNPLAASGGSDPEDADTLRDRIPVGLTSLGRAVSLADYADLARSWPGIGKASAVSSTDGRRRIVRVTVAGSAPSPLGADSDLIAGLQTELSAADPRQQVLVVPADLVLIVLRVSIVHSARWTWDSVSAAARANLLQLLSYRSRELGEDVLISPILAAVHRVPGVLSCEVGGLALISRASTPDQLADLANALAEPVCSRIRLHTGLDPRPTSTSVPAAQLAHLTDAVPDTLLLEGRTP
ncbi:MAG: baseplate J/gp47 family protein [Jatrophihabitantaceae bacterium]